MLDMSIGIAEHIARATIVFVFLFIALRFVGKKHVGELAPFDLVALLILSETVQNAMVGDDKSVTGEAGPSGNSHRTDPAVGLSQFAEQAG